MPDSPTSPDGRNLAQLAAAAAEGDRASFEILHRRLSGGLRKLFLERSGNKSDVADDLIQRTWVGVWQALSSGRYDPSRSAISTFVYAVAHKMWLQHLRARPASREQLPEETLSTSEEPAADLAEALDAIRAALAGTAGSLTPDERAVLRLCGLGASDRDLAARLSISPSTANARKRSAFEKLRRHLASLGHRPETAERLTGGGE